MKPKLLHIESELKTENRPHFQPTNIDLRQNLIDLADLDQYIKPSNQVMHPTNELQLAQYQTSTKATTNKPQTTNKEEVEENLVDSATFQPEVVPLNTSVVSEEDSGTQHLATCIPCLLTTTMCIFTITSSFAIKKAGLTLPTN